MIEACEPSREGRYRLEIWVAFSWCDLVSTAIQISFQNASLSANNDSILTRTGVRTELATC